MSDEDQVPTETQPPQPFDGSLDGVLSYLAAVLEENPRTSGKQALAALQEQADALPDADGPGAMVGSALDQFAGLIVADDGSEVSWQGVDYVRRGDELLEAADRLDERPRLQSTQGRVARLLRQWAKSG